MTHSVAEATPRVPPSSRSAREAILDAAAAAFGRDGFAGTSIRDIANASGVRSASLYHHFSSKEEIFEEVMRIGIDCVFDGVRTAVESAGPKASSIERIRCAIRAHLYSALEVGPYTQVNIRCSGQIPAHLKAKNAELRRPYEVYWRDLIRSGVAAGELCADTDVVLCTLYVFGFMNWTVEWYRPERFTLDAIIDQYTQMLTCGIASKTKSPASGPSRKPIDQGG